MNARSLAAFAAAFVALAAGCAAPAHVQSNIDASRAQVIDSRAAAAAPAAGSTRADVAAALGEAQVIRFHSGFEVWVYRIAAARNAARSRARTDGGELVILVTPDGAVAKTRIRAPAQPVDAGG